MVEPELSKQDFDNIVERSHLAIAEFYKGKPKQYIDLLSSDHDVSLLGAFGGYSVGIKDVIEHATSRASFFKAGHNVNIQTLVKHFEAGLGYAVELESFDAVVGDDSTNTHVGLRATTIFKLERGEWKIIHRIGDPLVLKIDPETYRKLAKHNEAKH
jgi:hypothetical protein